MTTKRIFITGATGCIGHYLLDQALAIPDAEIHVLVRTPEKLQRDPATPRLFIHRGELETIEEHAALIGSMTHIVLVATAWNNSDHAVFINRDKTHALLKACNPEICEKIVYFSTASILGPGNKVIPEAEMYGTGYVSSKSIAFRSLQNSPLYDRIVTVFPTMVFGGSERHPESHITSGLIPNLHYAKWIRFFDVDAKFHFLHAYDISQVVLYALFNKTSNELVLGQKVISANTFLERIYHFANIRQYFKVPIRPWFVLLLCKFLRIKLMPWDRYCITHPYMVYDTVNPETFGLVSKFPTPDALLKDIFERYEKQKSR